MKIRAQLAAAFLGLSVVPLAGLVGYSYASSNRAVREAVAADAAASAEEMKARLRDVERDLGRGVEQLGLLSPGATGSAKPPVSIDLRSLLRSVRQNLPEGDAGARTRTGRREPASGGAWIAAGVLDALLENIPDPDAPGPRRPEGRAFELPLEVPGQAPGRIKAKVASAELLGRLCNRAHRGAGEVPFVVDAAGTLHSLPGDARRLADLGVPETLSSRRDDWLIVTSKDAKSGLTFGIARPLSEPLRKVQSAAVRNFGWGLGLIGLALLGILPLSHKMTQSVEVITAGADRIAQGDLETRVPVLAGNELGRLAAAFNHMTEVLAEQRSQLVEGERQRQEAALRQHLLETEYQRKTAELEEARQFQLSLLPKALPVHPRFAVAASMKTATEVGGDYYDFRLSEDGILTVAIGDATGHGVKAGTLVTVVKSLFSAYADVAPLSTFLSEASEVIQRMGLDRMLMSATLVRFEGQGMTIAAAGMPPVLVFRASDRAVEEYVLPGMPLGGLAFDYRELRVPLSAGDTVLLMTDGLPESPGDGSEPLGYRRVAELFATLGDRPAEEIVAGLNAAAESRAGEAGLGDDVTFVVVQARG